MLNIFVVKIMLVVSMVVIFTLFETTHVIREATAVPRPRFAVQADFFQQLAHFEDMQQPPELRSNGSMEVYLKLQQLQVMEREQARKDGQQPDPEVPQDITLSSDGNEYIKAEEEEEEVTPRPVRARLDVHLTVDAIPSPSCPFTLTANAGGGTLWKVWEVKPTIKVLVWNSIHGYTDWLGASFLEDARTKCSTECIFTEDRGQLGQADGVLFHGPNHQPLDFPPEKPQGQMWIFMSLEQPHYFQAPGNLCEEAYINRFDYTSTYELDSTVPVTCIHPHWDADYYHGLQPETFQDKDGYGAPAAAATFTSNCRNAGAEKRLQYLEELSRHMDVHSYGNCLHNRDEPRAPPGTSRAVNKQKVLRKYKFYLAFENNIIRDYVSEKVFDGLLAGSLPVYWGTRSITKYLPSDRSCIYANDFAGPKELADYLKEVANNQTLYDSYFTWKQDKPKESFRRVLESTAYKYTSMCNICERLALQTAPPPLAQLMDFSQQ